MCACVLVCECARMCVCAREKVCVCEREKKRRNLQSERNRQCVCVSLCVCVCASLNLCSVFAFGACEYEHRCDETRPPQQTAHNFETRNTLLTSRHHGVPQLAIFRTRIRTRTRTPTHQRTHTRARTRSHVHAHTHAHALLGQLTIPLVSSTRFVCGCSSPVSLTYTRRNEIFTCAKFLR